jgi:hypothetical protein
MSLSEWSRQLLVAGLLLASAQAAAAESGAKQGADPARRVSPYARYAQEHAKSESAKAARVKVKRSSSARTRGRH